MGVGILRVWVAVMLVASGALMWAASWQRWAGACPFNGDQETDACYRRMDHLYDFLPPSEPWMPVGNAAELAGLSLLVLAAALVASPWALAARRPGPWTALALFATLLAVVAVGLAALRSGLAGEVVRPAAADASVLVWGLVPPVLYGRLAVLARGWARVAAILLVLASPLVGAFTYAIGPFDANPWWEAIMGLLLILAGAGLLVAAARRSGVRPPQDAEVLSVPAPADVTNGEGPRDQRGTASGRPSGPTPASSASGTSRARRRPTTRRR